MITLYYQLLQAYQPYRSLPMSTPIAIVQNIETPQVLGVKTTRGIGGIKENQQIITIAVLGDSMIDTLGPDIPALKTALEQYFPGKKFKILNYGIGASNIEYALFRLKNNYQYNGQDYPSLLSLKPDIFIIESFAYNNFGNTQVGIDRQWQALSNITSTIQNELPAAKIVLAATIAPNSLSFTNGVKDLHLTNLEKIEKTKTIKIYLQNIINFAQSQKFPLANAFTNSLKNGEGLPELISKTDNIHSSDLGAQFFSDTLAKTLFDNKIIE